MPLEMLTSFGKPSIRALEKAEDSHYSGCERNTENRRT